MTARYPRPEVLGRVHAPGAPAPRHVVLEASAGTGKTHALEHAVLDLVLSGVAVERVVVVTFTERAAAELRRKVRARLADALDVVAGRVVPREAAQAWLLDDAARVRLEAALAAFDLAPIGTIHGLCRRLLDEHALLAGQPLDPPPFDDADGFEAAWEEALRVELATGAAGDLRAWLERRPLEELKELLRKVERERPDVLRPTFDPDALVAAARSLARIGAEPAVAAARAAVATTPAIDGRRRGKLARTVNEVHAAVAAWGGESALQLLLDPALDDGVPYLLEQRALLAPLPALGPWLDGVAALAAQRVDLAAAAAARFLPAIAARRRARRLALGPRDPDDLVRGAADAVRGPGGPALVAALRARFERALVDEFQDTDSDPWTLLRAVFVDGAPPTHGLWVVGDPKQAIYGFRGADVYVYLRARAELARAGAPVVQLAESHRHTVAMSAALDLVFDPDAPAPLLPGPITYARTTSAGVRTAVDAQGRAVAPLHVLRFVDPGRGWTADRVRDAHARWIADEARRLVEAGGWRVGSTRSGEPLRPLAWRDLMVLVRGKEDAERVSRALRAARVPHAFHRQEGLWATDEADDVLRLLEALEDPRDRGRRLLALATPLAGGSLACADALADLGDDDPRVRRLLQWARLAGERRWERIAAALVDEAGFPQRELLLRGRTRSLVTTAQLLEAVVLEAARGRLDIGQVVRRVRGWVAGRAGPAGDDQDVLEAEPGRDAVAVLTMHKSKGLEAEVVFLFGGLASAAGRDEVHRYHEDTRPRPEDDDLPPRVSVYHEEGPAGWRRVVHVGPLDAAIEARVLRELEDEDRRLLYVAATRARARLVVPSFGRSAQGWDFPRLGGVQGHLAPRLEELREAGLLVPPTARVDDLPLEVRPAGPAPRDLEAALLAWRPPALPELAPQLAAEAEAMALLRLRAAPLRLTSFSRIKSLVGGGAGAAPAARLSPPAPSVPRVDSTDLPPGTGTGNCVHELLERVPLGALREEGAARSDPAAWAARPDVEPLLRRALRRHGLAPAHAPAVGRLVHAALVHPLRLGPDVVLAGGIARQADVSREVPFVYPLPEAADGGRLIPPPGGALTVERGFVRGSIDLVLRHAGKGWLFDWKTNSLDAWDPASLRATVDEAYALQGRIYALALAKMLRIDGPAACEARLGGVGFLFLRGLEAPSPALASTEAGLVVLRPTWDDLQAWAAALAIPAEGGA